MKNAVLTLLESNATSFRERNEVYAVMENQKTQVEATMVANLYRSAIEKSHIDFDDIPESKGDVTKYAGYKSMRETHEIIENLAKRYNQPIPAELATVKESLRILEGNRERFIKGFLLENNLVKMIYITTVAATVEATSVIISSYVEFVKNPEAVEMKITKNNHRPSQVSIDSLKEFNESVKKGHLSTILNEVNKGKDNFIGVDPLITGAIIVGALITIVPVMRELIFCFYHSRVQISDYLDHQAQLIALNKASVEASALPAKEKKEVAKKQQRRADQIMRLSDKIRVESVKTQAQAHSAIKQENKKWTLDSVQSQFASEDSNGFGLL